jgi:hypothetical protein
LTISALLLLPLLPLLPLRSFLLSLLLLLLLLRLLLLLLLLLLVLLVVVVVVVVVVQVVVVLLLLATLDAPRESWCSSRRATKSPFSRQSPNPKSRSLMRDLSSRTGRLMSLAAVSNGVSFTIPL